MTAPLMGEWPLWVLWLVALSLGGVCDLDRLWDIEFPEPRYILGLVRIICYNVCLSALLAYVVAALAHACRTRWVRWPLAAVALILIGTYLFIRYHYGSRLTPEIATVIRETNRSEASEYLGTYVFSLSGIPIILSLLLSLSGWCWIDLWWHHRQNGITPRPLTRWKAAVCSVATMLVLFGSYKMVRSWPLADVLTHQSRSHYDNFGVDALTNLMKCHHHLQRIDDQTLQAISATRQVYSTPSRPVTGDSLTVVVVIGESYIKSHASIYGYDKPTTPIQERERDADRLIIFSDMVSPYSYTNMAMRCLLSVNDQSLGQMWCDSPLFPAIFKHGGYQVDLWDNQREFMKGSVNTNGLNGLMYHPDVINLCYTHINDRNSEFDGDFIEDYANHRHTSVHELVLLHLRGQHIKAERRYPHSAQWTLFRPEDYSDHNPPLDGEARSQVAHYDNATHYNDHVLGQIFSLFSDRTAVVVCLSDHGDEVHDYRAGIGRRDNDEHPELMVRYQHAIPFVVWCSPRLQQTRPHLVEQLRQASTRRGTLDNVSQMLLGLSGIETPWYHAERDILSSAYECPRRVVRDKYDYDQLMQQFQ